MTRRAKPKRASLAAIRRALADYIHSEGCGCCEGGEHEAHKTALAELLRVKMYPDKSGWDFRPYRTKK